MRYNTNVKNWNIHNYVSGGWNTMKKLSKIMLCACLAISLVGTGALAEVVSGAIDQPVQEASEFLLGDGDFLSVDAGEMGVEGAEANEDDAVLSGNVDLPVSEAEEITIDGSWEMGNPTIDDGEEYAVESYDDDDYDDDDYDDDDYDDENSDSEVFSYYYDGVLESYVGDGGDVVIPDTFNIIEEEAFLVVQM